MAAILYVLCFLVCWTCVQVTGISIDAKVDSELDKDATGDATVALRMAKSAYEVNFEGLKKPVRIDCNQEGVICKFPLSNPQDETAESRKIRKPSEKIEQIPIFTGIDVQSDNKKKEEGENKIKLLIPKKENPESSKVPIFRGTVDIESLSTDGKNLDSILENHIPDKAPVNVYLSKYPSHVPSVYFMYHSPYDIHDHIGAGPYQYPLAQPTYRWTPFLRPGNTRNPHIVTNAPCDPPVYNYQPPPCSHIRPTVKPVINIDDKIDN